MKNFMVLVLKIAYTQHLSNDTDNAEANYLYESFFPNPKKRSGVSQVNLRSKPNEQAELVNVQIKNHGGAAACMLDDNIGSDLQIPSPKLRAQREQ